MKHRGDGWSLAERDPKVIEELMPYWEWFYTYYFRVRTDGWQHVPANGPVLLVGSHNGGLAAPDMVMMMVDWFRRFGSQRPAYGLMHPNVWKAYSPLAQLAVRVGAVQAHPKMAIAALKGGASVLVYPGGGQDAFRPYCQRHQIQFFGRKGFIKLALREEVPLIPLISLGAHETLFVLGDFYPQAKKLHEWGMPWLLDIDPEVFPIYCGLPWGLTVGPLLNLPLPVSLHTRVCEPITFERYGRAASSDRAYVDACYELVRQRMQGDLDRLVGELGVSHQ